MFTTLICVRSSRARLTDALQKTMQAPVAMSELLIVSLTFLLEVHNGANIYFYLNLVKSARNAIIEQNFEKFAQDFEEKYTRNTWKG